MGEDRKHLSLRGYAFIVMEIFHLGFTEVSTLSQMFIVSKHTVSDASLKSWYNKS